MKCPAFPAESAWKLTTAVVSECKLTLSSQAQFFARIPLVVILSGALQREGPFSLAPRPQGAYAPCGRLETCCCPRGKDEIPGSFALKNGSQDDRSQLVFQGNWVFSWPSLSQENVSLRRAALPPKCRNSRPRPGRPWYGLGSGSTARADGADATYPSFRFLPTAFRLLPTAFRLLPSAYCLLPSAYCLPPTALRTSPKSGWTTPCCGPFGWRARSTSIRRSAVRCRGT